MRYGRWLDHSTWICLCLQKGERMMSNQMMPFAKACAWCHVQRPRKNHGGKRPRKP